ncbi:PAS domain-containing protein [Alteromonas sp. a30]|nr:PAS domain-containing protein [Alteromonas sp. a30]
MVNTYQLITAEISDRLSVHEQLNQANRIYLEQNDYKENFEALNNLMFNQLKAFRDIDAVYFSSRENWFSGYARFDDTIVHMYANEDTQYNIHYEQLQEDQKTRKLLQIAPDFYATQSNWYQEAAPQPERGWGSSFSYYVLPTLAMPNSVKIIDDNGKDVGVVGNDLFLDKLGDVLKNFFELNSGSAFIINDSGDLIGSSNHYRPYHIINGDIIQTNVEDSQDRLIQTGMEVYNSLPREEQRSPQLRPVTIDDQSYQLGIFQFTHGDSISWTLFIYLAEQGILEQANRSLYQSLSSILAGMLLTMFMSAFLANKIAAPIHNLNKKVQEWKNHPSKLVEEEKIESRIVEVGQLTDSALQMHNNTARVMQELQKTITENRHFINEIEKLAMVAENTDDMVLICNAEQMIEWANNSFLNNYSLALSDVIECSALELLLSPKERETETHSINVQLSSLGFAKVQHVHYDATGSPHWVKINIRQVMEKSDTKHYIFIMQDITAQKSYEQELTKWKTVFYAADWGIAISENDDMSLTLANPTFAKLHGYDLQVSNKANMSMFYPDEALPLIRDYMNIAKETGSVTFETEHIKNSGQRFPVLQNISAFHDQQGELAGYITSIQDISEIKSLQYQLVQSQKMEAMGTLAGGMAHDFNNILASILGNAELCNLYIENISDVFKHSHLETLSERLESIVKSCSRASDLTNKILSYSRMDSPDFAPLHLSEILQESIAMIRPMLPATIHIDFEDNAYIDIIEGNESQLQQVFMNLLTNALHAIESANRKSGNVCVHMENQVDDIGEAYVKLELSDNGSGISKSALTHIFDPFFTTKEKGKGTGLGLSVVSGILRGHNVKIDVKSVVDQGTQFIMLFPLNGDQALIPRETDANTILPDIPNNSHLVIVDDESQITEVWGRILSEKGFRITAFNDAKSALSFIRDHYKEVDLVISDYDMADMNGAEFCGQLHRELPTLPLIMLTGYSEKMDDNLAKELGICRLLLKPISLGALLKAITQTLR